MDVTVTAKRAGPASGPLVSHSMSGMVAGLPSLDCRAHAPATPVTAPAAYVPGRRAGVRRATEKPIRRPSRGRPAPLTRSRFVVSSTRTPRARPYLHVVRASPLEGSAPLTPPETSTKVGGIGAATAASSPLASASGSSLEAGGSSAGTGSEATATAARPPAASATTATKNGRTWREGVIGGYPNCPGGGPV